MIELCIHSSIYQHRAELNELKKRATSPPTYTHININKYIYIWKLPTNRIKKEMVIGD
jgi:hypothetical protein